MTSNKMFFIEKQTAAVFKHKLLEDYLATWAGKLGSRSRGGLAFVDGYAGAGRYAGTGEGSPVIAMRIARAQPSVDLQCVFVEKSPSTAAQLAGVIRAEGAGLNVTGPLIGTLEERLDQVLAAIGARPALFFLDPFGTALDPNLLISRILNRKSYSTEVLLNFNLEAVWRMGGFLSSERAMANRDAYKTIEAADRFLGGDWWHDDFIQARRQAQENDEFAPAAKAAARVADRYREMIEYRSGYSGLSVPVRRKRDTEPFFSLMLFHRKEAAKLPFIDAAARAHRKWREEDWERYAERVNTPGALFDLEFAPDREAQEKQLKADGVSYIYGQLRRLLEQQPVFRLGSVMEQVFGLYIGTSGEAELRAAWKALARDGISCQAPSGHLAGATISRR